MNTFRDLLEVKKDFWVVDELTSKVYAGPFPGKDACVQNLKDSSYPNSCIVVYALEKKGTKKITNYTKVN